MKLIFCIICLFTAFCTQAQISIAPHIDYSIKHYLPGGGLDAGVMIGKSYLGINNQILFTNKRDVPVYVNLQYGYSIGKFQPFIYYGYFTCGNEAIRMKEGKHGFALGGGISFFPTEQLKISAGTQGISIAAFITF